MDKVALSRMFPVSEELHRHLDRKSQITLPTTDLSNESATPSTLPSCPSPHPQLSSSPGTAVSSLQSKVKAGSQSRMVKRGRDGRELAALIVGPGHTQNIKRGREKNVSTLLTLPVSSGTGKRSSSSDEEVEPQYQVRTYLTDPLQVDGDEQKEEERAAPSMMSVCALSRGSGEGASLENLFDDICRFQEEPTSVKPWIHPKEHWKAARPETLLLNGSTQLRDGPSGEAPVEAGRQRNAKSAVEQGLKREQQRSRNSTAGHPWRHLQKEAGFVGPHGGLWRADSWDSVCSSSSSVSLAERVEMNRGVLKHMLNKALHKGVKETDALEPEQTGNNKMTTQSNGRGFISINDSDWDSGISLQDSEHTHRSLVSGDELPLSPRLQQAKLLLERARAKTRRFPLKGDHTILPRQRSHSELGGAAAPLSPLPGTESLTAGNLSDSSSGDSACGPRRRCGTSPTRVRFQDESEKDAEVRYLERQRRRVAERAQDLLGLQPGFSDNLIGTKDCSLAANRPANNRNLGIHDGSLGKNGCRSQEAVARKCHSCGTVLETVPEPQLNPCSPSQSLQTASERKMLPCWVAPSDSNLAIHTDYNPNTYRGKAGSIHGRDLSHTESKSVLRAEESALTHEMLKGKSRGNPRLETGLHVPPEAGSSGDDLLVLAETSYPKLRQCGIETIRPPSPCGQNMGVSSYSSVPCAASRCQMSSSVKTSVQPQAKVTLTSPQPRKSALSHTPRTRSPGQRVKILPSLQYRLIDLDAEDNLSNLDSDQQEESHSQQYQEDSHTKVGCMENNPTSTELDSQGLCANKSTGTWIYTTSRKPPDQGVCQGSRSAPETQAVNLSQRMQGDLCQNNLSYCPSTVPTPGRSVEPFCTRPAVQELQAEGSAKPAHLLDPQSKVQMAGSHQRGGKARLSLRQFFSSITLNGAGKLGKGRSSSMEHLSSFTSPSCASPDPAHKQRSRLKKAPSLQSLRLASPLAHLQKASSVQSLLSPKKKRSACSSYAPGDHPTGPVHSNGLPRTLSVDDVGSPSGMRSVGRVAQAFSDGTLLLELTRPPQGAFGFLISRGKGRPDSGVYVEEISDSSTQKIYAGLLGVGDEILEVNGEKVAGLSLEQVTWLMTQGSTASIRVLRHRRAQK